ncbi:MAG: MFS transporter [Actinobacteria bacterium]|nr:MFS transporter [Actinomycetota bacterium]
MADPVHDHPPAPPDLAGSAAAFALTDGSGATSGTDAPGRPGAQPAADDRAGPHPATGSDPEGPGGRAQWQERMFASPLYSRLWRAQVVSSMGDWIGFLAIAAAAARVGGGSPETAVGLVMSARIAPGFFLGPMAGVLVDRWDRKKVMVACDLGRAATLAFLPFITRVWQLLLASLVLEVFTLLWSPAKEASVPNLVPSNRLATANSLSLVAAYGTFPFASALFALLARVAQALGGIAALGSLKVNQESVAFWFDAATFGLSALIIFRLPLPRLSRAERAERADQPQTHGLGSEESPPSSVASAITELREGWRYIFLNPVVRAVNLGLATGLVGGAMVVPLGPVFSKEVLGAGTPGFGLLTTALGLGVAIGILLVSLLQKHVPHARVFTHAVLVAGCSIVLAASMSSLAGAASSVALLGIAAGGVYVLGFTLLHENVDDQLRGRIFSALYTLVRLCVLIAFAVAPLLSGVLGGLSRRLLGDSRFTVGGLTVFVPGVRLTLWLAGLIILAAWVLTSRSLRGVDRAHDAAGDG